jgi:hypothetical protein
MRLASGLSVVTKQRTISQTGILAHFGCEAAFLKNYISVLIFDTFFAHTSLAHPLHSMIYRVCHDSNGVMFLTYLFDCVCVCVAQLACLDFPLVPYCCCSASCLHTVF